MGSQRRGSVILKCTGDQAFREELLESGGGNEKFPLGYVPLQYWKDIQVKLAMRWFKVC